MKTARLFKIICISTAIVFCSQASLQAGNAKAAAPDSAICLKVTGKILARAHKANVHDLNTVTLYYDNKAIQTMEVADGKTFRFFLKKNRHYAIKISRDGFIPNLMSFNTVLPKGEDVFGVSSFFFNTELIAESETINYNTDALDFPAAIVSFIPKKQTFDVSKKYTQQIEQEIVTKPEGTVVSQNEKSKSRKQSTGQAGL